MRSCNLQETLKNSSKPHHLLPWSCKRNTTAPPSKEMLKRGRKLIEKNKHLNLSNQTKQKDKKNYTQLGHAKEKRITKNLLHLDLTLVTEIKLKLHVACLTGLSSTCPMKPQLSRKLPSHFKAESSSSLLPSSSLSIFLGLCAWMAFSCRHLVVGGCWLIHQVSVCLFVLRSACFIDLARWAPRAILVSLAFSLVHSISG